MMQHVEKHAAFTKATKIIALVGAALILICGITACMFMPPEEEPNAEEIKSSLKLKWSDEFNSNSTKVLPSSANWDFGQKGDGSPGNPGWGNNEVQLYDNDINTCYVSDGKLKIRAYKDSSGRWRSARLRTVGKVYKKYGFIEARIKLPGGEDAKGVWPAFWMMPETSEYGPWPTSGEIDIMEYGPNHTGVDYVYSTLHWGEAWNDHHYKGIGSKTIQNVHSEFHTYAVYWTEDFIKVYYDGEKVGDTYYAAGKDVNGGWPFDQDFHIIVNMAMGGNLGGAIVNGNDKIVEFDYIRWYQ